MSSQSQPRSRLRDAAVVTVFFCIVTALAAEAVVRVYHAAKNRDIVYVWKAPSYWFLYADHDAFGWMARPDYRLDWTVSTLEGEPYEVHYTTDARGMRPTTRHGDRPNLLVVGDSFTQAAQANDGETYYNHLGEALGYDVTAYGVGGYGSLQELMALRYLMESTKPDLVVWQACANDFMNNDYELERQSRLYNVRRRRPYLEDGEIVYRKPFSVLQSLVNRVPRTIRFPHTAMGLIQRVSAGRLDVEAEEAVELARMDSPEFRASVAATKATFAQAAELLDDTPWVLFNVDAYRTPYQRIYERLSGELNIPLVGAGLPTPTQRPDLYAADGLHWSQTGHKVVADHLQAEITVLLTQAHADSSDTAATEPAGVR